MIINHLTSTKIKSNIVFLSVKVLIDISWYFVYALSPATNRSQQTLNVL